jgi:polar amino acid transport system substrate-binding protein
MESSDLILLCTGTYFFFITNERCFLQSRIQTGILRLISLSFPSVKAKQYMRKFLILGVTLLASTLTFAKEPVRFLVSEAWSMPFGEIVSTNNGVVNFLKRGIMLDWQNAIAAELNRTPVMVISSRKRMELYIENGQVDIRCFTAPDWVSDKTLYFWPHPFYKIQDVLAGSSNLPLIKSLTELNGKSIGTVLGYHYRTLQPLFDAGIAFRDDAPSEMLALKKQLFGRTNYLVIRHINLEYQQQINPETRTLRVSPLAVEDQSIYCAIPKNGHITLAEYEAAQAKLLQAGVLEKILAQYR